GGRGGRLGGDAGPGGARDGAADPVRRGPLLRAARRRRGPVRARPLAGRKPDADPVPVPPGQVRVARPGRVLGRPGRPDVADGVRAAYARPAVTPSSCSTAGAHSAKNFSCSGPICCTNSSSTPASAYALSEAMWLSRSGPTGVESWSGWTSSH